MFDRYSRQILLPEIGEAGQKKLANSSVIIIGCGGLGATAASLLVRAGVGKVRVVDRDFIEYHNLHRQILFDEDDVRSGLPKAIAAELKLKKINSSVEVEGIVTDVNYTNIERLVTCTDLILDGLDNFEGRFLINDVSLKHNIPWVYGAAISSSGMTMSIIPHQTPCLRCRTFNIPNPKIIQTCDTTGVIGPAPLVIGSLQSVEAMKILTGAEEINRDLILIDVWQGSFERLKISRRKDCPACRGKYEFLEGQPGLKATSLCGQDAVQVINPGVGEVSLEKLAERLRQAGEVSLNEFMLRFRTDGQEIVIFPDGRAIIKGTSDESLARGLYAKYIGA